MRDVPKGFIAFIAVAIVVSTLLIWNGRSRGDLRGNLITAGGVVGLLSFTGAIVAILVRARKK
jgi:hypothetical protein